MLLAPVFIARSMPVDVDHVRGAGMPFTAKPLIALFVPRRANALTAADRKNRTVPRTSPKVVSQRIAMKKRIGTRVRTRIPPRTTTRTHHLRKILHGIHHCR